SVKGIDFWSEEPGHGRIVVAEVGKAKNEGNHAWIVTRNEWRTAEDLAIIREERTLHLYDLSEARLIVFEIDLKAKGTPVTFGDSKEGALAVRIRDEISVKRGKGCIENADGKQNERECWGRESKWCDYSGPVDGKTIGLAILDDPGNPSPARWHCRDYGL